MNRTDRNTWHRMQRALATDPVRGWLWDYCGRHEGDDFDADAARIVLQRMTGAPAEAFDDVLEELCTLGFVRTHRLRSGALELRTATCPREVDHWAACRGVNA